MKLLLLICLFLGATGCVLHLFPQINFRKMPAGLTEGVLADGKPNWVSSRVAQNNPHYIAPLQIKLLPELSVCIKNTIPHVSIERLDAQNLIGYRQTSVFHFVDWFCIYKDGHVTSSATMGYSDFGKNRELIEAIRALCL